MRNKNRIKRICNIIERLWMYRQDERFGQFLINLGIAQGNNTLWYLEDDEIEAPLKELLDKLDKNDNKK